MIASTEAARSNFQSRIDNVKFFLRQRNVNKNVRGYKGYTTGDRNIQLFLTSFFFAMVRHSLKE
jgi:hypothetical protein